MKKTLLTLVTIMALVIASLPLTAEVSSDGKCGEGKCATGKCGQGKCASGKCGGGK
jgi:uncharacterized low-complexity protein